MRKTVISREPAVMAPVQRPGAFETGNVFGACLVYVLTIGDAFHHPCAVDAVAVGFVCAIAGWTFARWQAWERAVSVTVVTVSAGDDAPPKEPPDAP